MSTPTKPIAAADSLSASIPSLSSPPALGARGERALNRAPLLRCSLFECQYAESNPSGWINLGVAENSLCVDWLSQYFERNFKLSYSDLSTYGTALTGSLRLFAALRHLFGAYFHARIPVEPAHIITGAGCSAIIDSLVSILADPGDGILVAKPHYNGFVSSFGCRNEVEAVGVDLPEGKEASIEALEAFERKLVERQAAGQRVRAIMLCNPHNPLGFCYSRNVLLAYCSFAEKHNLHLIVDEIYALSTFSTTDTPAPPVPFTSILSLDPLAEAGCNPSRVHMVYSASKDFGANALRLGVLVSQVNPDVHAAIESSCLLMKISSAADILWSSLLLDPVALPTYLALNQSLLSTAYARATAFLDLHCIPYRPSSAGHFVWIDLRRFLPTVAEGEGDVRASEEERETALATRLMQNGVNLARGSAYCGTPGFFRLTFTLRADYFEIGLRRLEQALGLAT
ncbi:hypothetical protein JCM6882_003488 [Rhodosporidiobolus microsporus]